MNLMEKAANRWYAAVSALLFLWTLNHLVSQWSAPVSSDTSLRQNRLQGRDLGTRLTTMEKALETPTQNDSLEVSDPFRMPQLRKPKQSSSGTTKKGNPLPPREFSLRGITNNNTAILVNGEGKSFVVEKGDVVDDATVISIRGSEITLRDKAGLFTLQIEP